MSDCTKFVEIEEDWRTLLFRYQDNVSRFIDKLYKCFSIDDDGQKNLENSGSTPRKVYGLPKVHKRKDTDVPFRPILSTIDTHNYNLSKFLVTLLAGVSRSVYTIKYLLTFPSKISKSRNDYYRFMASFDMASLFTNIPVNKNINIIFDRLLTKVTNIRASQRNNSVKC